MSEQMTNELSGGYITIIIFYLNCINISSHFMVALGISNIINSIIIALFIKYLTILYIYFLPHHKLYDVLLTVHIQTCLNIYCM